MLRDPHAALKEAPEAFEEARSPSHGVHGATQRAGAPGGSLTQIRVPQKSMFGPHAHKVTPCVLVKQRSPLMHRGARSPHVACAVPERTSDCAHC